MKELKSLNIKQRVCQSGLLGSAQQVLKNYKTSNTRRIYDFLNYVFSTFYSREIEVERYGRL